MSIKRAFLSFFVISFTFISVTNGEVCNTQSEGEAFTSECYKVFQTQPMSGAELGPFRVVRENVKESAVLTEILQNKMQTIDAYASQNIANSNYLESTSSKNPVNAFNQFYDILKELKNSEPAKALRACEDNDCSYGENFSPELVDEIARHETPGRKCVKIKCDIKTYLKHFKAVSILQAQKVSHLMRYPYLADEDLIEKFEDKLNQEVPKDFSEQEKKNALSKIFEKKKEELKSDLDKVTKILGNAKEEFNSIKARGSQKRSNRRTESFLNRANDEIYNDYLSDITNYMDLMGEEALFQKYGQTFCRMRSKIERKIEFDDNVKLATDIGLFVAPMLLGGPIGLAAGGLMKGALGAAKVARMMNLGFKGVSVGKFGTFALTEGTLASVDMKNLKERANQCSLLLNQFQMDPSKDGLSKVDKCKAEYDSELNQTLLFAGAGVLGEGVFATVKIAKNALRDSKNINEHNLERALDSYRTRTGQKVPEMNAKYLASDEAQDVMQRARAKALELNPKLNEEQLSAIALGAAHAHLVEIGSAGITSLKSATTKGTDTFSQEGKDAKMRIMEAYGVDAKTRRAFMEEGITGRTLEASFTIHKNDPSLIRTIDGNSGIDFNAQRTTVTESYIPNNNSGKPTTFSSMQREDLRDHLSTIDLTDIKGGYYQVKNDLDNTTKTLSNLSEQVAANRKRPGNTPSESMRVSEYYLHGKDNSVTYEAGESVFKIIGNQDGKIKVLMSTNGGKAVEIPVKDENIRRKLSSAIDFMASADNSMRSTTRSTVDIDQVRTQATRTIESQMGDLIQQSETYFRQQSEEISRRIGITEKLQRSYGNNFNKLPESDLNKVAGQLDQVIQ